MLFASTYLFALAKGLKIFFAIILILIFSLIVTGIVAFSMLRSNAKKRKKQHTRNFQNYNR